MVIILFVFLSKKIKKLNKELFLNYLFTTLFLTFRYLLPIYPHVLSYWNDGFHIYANFYFEGILPLLPGIVATSSFMIYTLLNLISFMYILKIVREIIHFSRKKYSRPIKNSINTD